MSPLPPTKQQTGNKLRALVADMADVAVDIDYYGGFDPIYHRHACELIEASIIIKQWLVNYTTPQEIPCPNTPAPTVSTTAHTANNATLSVSSATQPPPKETEN